MSADGTYLAAGRTDNTILLWNVRRGSPPRQLGQLEEIHGTTGGLTGVYALAFSPDGSSIVVGDLYGGIRLFDLNGKERVILPQGKRGGVDRACFSPDGKQLVTSASQLADDQSAYVPCVDVWEKQGGTYVHRNNWNCPNPSNASGEGPPSVAMSADGKLIATGDSSGGIVISDAHHQKQVSHFPVDGWIDSMAFSPAGDRIAWACVGWVYCGRLADGHIQRFEELCENACVRFADNGRLIEAWGGETGNIYVAWESPSGNRVRLFDDTKRLAEVPGADISGFFGGKPVEPPPFCHRTRCWTPAAVKDVPGGWTATMGNDDLTTLSGWDPATLREMTIPHREGCAPK